MNRKKKMAIALVAVASAVLMGFAPQAHAQAASAQPQAAAQPAPAVAAAPDPCESLTPYQKSLLDRTLYDWPYLAKFRDANAALPPPAAGETRVVFLGDSITEGWGMKATEKTPQRGEFFPGKPYLNRGISGQTSPQMLVRFQQDVVSLKPKVVVILAGTNDLAQNTGPETQDEIGANIANMVELARAAGIKVVLCSVLPSSEFWWHKGLQPAPKIRALNEWIKDYAAKNNVVYVDYYTPMVNADGGLKTEYSPDGVHPNAAGYGLMGPIAEKGIAQALAQ
jgi:acyl-CoA thioesterase I